MTGYFVEIVSRISDKVEKRMGPTDKRTAEKIEKGALINLNHDDFYIRLVSE